MPTKAKTGAKPSAQKAAPPKQTPKLPLKATINWLNPDENDAIRAKASLTIGEAFAVHGIKVISGAKGDFVSMPSYKSGGDYKQIFHAVTAETRQQMNDTVIAAYEHKLTEEQEQGEESAEDMEKPDESDTEQGLQM